MSNHLDGNNWDRLSKALRDADCVPEAPDCRQAVMTRIAPPRGRSFVWAYGFAAAVVVIGAGMALIPHPAPKSNRAAIAKREAPAPPKVALQATPIPTVQEAPSATPVKRTPLPVHRVRERTAQIAPRPITPQREVVEHVVVGQTPPPPTVIRLTPDRERPVAIAIVTWPSAKGRQQDSYSYGYKDRNTATGQTTECRVKRSGNSVEIYMESKPEAKEPPVKGSVDYEPKPSV